MELNRNQYFLIGLVCLFIGMQLRTIESYVLNAPASQFVSEKVRLVSRNESPEIMSAVQGDPEAADIPVTTHRTVKPPVWLGWAFISVGVLMVLHSLAMKRPH